jgi:cytoskeletal protein RodZ
LASAETVEQRGGHTVPSAAPPGIGTKLRRARIERSLSIEETAWRTRIRPDTLRALESEEFKDIGHLATVRTHLHSYARFLGIDPTQVVDQFEQQQDEPLPSALEELDRQVKTARKPPRAKWLIAAALSTAVLIAAAIAGVLGGQAERPAVDPSANALSRLVPSPGAVPASEARVTMRVLATARTEISITADGAHLFDGTLLANESKTFRARDTLDIMVANAGTVELSLNGVKLEPLGKRGELVRARFGANGRIPD